MTTLQTALYELETLKDAELTDPKTLEDCVKVVESLLKKEQWDLDRAYDSGWNDCLNNQNK